MSICFCKNEWMRKVNNGVRLKAMKLLAKKLRCFLVASIKNKWVRGFFIIEFLLVISTSPALATCTLNLVGGNWTDTIYFSNAEFSRDATVGTAITKYVTGTWRTMRCSVSGGSVESTATIIGGELVPGYTKTYKTGVEGIGIQFFGIVYGASNTRQAPFSELYPSSVSTGFNAAAKLIVTGPVKGGKITSLPQMKIVYKQGSDKEQSYTLTVSAPISIASNGCRINNPTIDVPMPRSVVTSREIPGSLFGSKSFNINLVDCSTDVKVYAALTDASDPSNSSETLSLSSASTAKGVGFRVTHEGKVVRFTPDSSVSAPNNQFLVTINPATSFSIPMEVSYIRTNEGIQAGTAIGNIILNMSYQ